MVAGYKSGAVALWDMKSYKLERLMTDVHETEVTGAKVYYISEENYVSIVSAEAKGKVCMTEVSYKGFFSGTTHTKTVLFEKRLKTATTVAVHRCPERFEGGNWGKRCLVAFGSTSEVVVCAMKPIQELIKFKRPAMCRPKSVPYLDFGFGLSPGKQEYCVPMLVIAWDCLI